MGVYSFVHISSDETAQLGPAQADLDKCVHCGLCLNACPTYRELGVEIDSPRGRIFLMNQVANGAPLTDSYMQHIDLCLACRGCESACPSGVPYGRMVEAAREQIELYRTRSAVQEFYRKVVFEKLLPSRSALQVAGGVLYLYQITGLQKLARFTGILRPFGKLAKLDSMSPTAEIPFFYSKIGRTYRAVGERRFRVAFVAGCIANVAFARLNEATVRVLQRNHCEVVIPAAQNCCGALHLHSGYKQQAQDFARRNIDAFLSEDFDAILTNAAGCGSTLKEYDHLLADDPAYAEKALKFKGRMEDVTRFLSAIELNEDMGRVDKIATYQDSCHLAHGQGIKMAPRKLLKIIPGLQFREMPMSDICCGSAGVYNVVQPEMATTLLQKKMETINGLDATLITTANPGCMLQLSAGVRLYGRGQKVAHVVEVLDEAYKNFAGRALLRTRGLKRFF